MAIYKFPSEDDPASKSKESSKGGKDSADRKLPEFIVIDDEKQENYSEEEMFAAEFHRMRARKIPFYIRTFCLLMGMLTLLFTAAALVSYAVVTLACVLTLYRVRSLRVLAHTFWKQLKRSAAFTIGLLVSVFSPTLGLGMVMLYFMLHHNPRDENPMERILRENLGEYLRRK